MSKETFRVQLMNDIHKRFQALDDFRLDDLFQMDDTFRLALCIAFMTLSKESIILKDKKNTDRLGRLTKQVPTVDIDSMFHGEVQPTVFNALESDPVWLLDCIRDSIMHEHFEIDEEHRKIILHNTGYGRTLDAEVPFDWFFKYVEEGIYNQRFTDHYTVKGFYYDSRQNDPLEHPSFRKGSKKYKSYFAVNNHILYRVNVTGERVPVDAIETRARELFDYFGKTELTEEEKAKYSSKIHGKPFYHCLYNRDYLISFFRTADYVENILRAEYPDCDIHVQMDPKKDKYIRQMRKKYNASYVNYDDLFHKMNALIVNRKDSFLKMIDRIYDVSSMDLSHAILDDLMELLVQLVSGSEYHFGSDVNSNAEDLLHAQLSLKDVLFQIYGLCILSMNKSAFNTDDTLAMIQQNMTGYSRDALKSFITKRRKLVHTLLDTETKIDENNRHLASCPDSAKGFLTKRVEEMTRERDQAYRDFCNLDVMHHMILSTEGVKEHKDVPAHMLEQQLEKYFNSFMKVSPDRMSSNGIPVREVLRNIIYSVLDRLDTLQENYYLYECEPRETLEMIRNSFSHAGRVKVTDYYYRDDAHVFLNDYDDQGHISGVVKTNYSGLIQFLYSGFDSMSMAAEVEDEDENEDEKINLFD